MMHPAPFHAQIADAPEGSAAYWVKTSDGLRVRVGHFPCQGAAGTVLLFPGRTEYIEKYGRTARDLVARGFAVLAIDWRGQGLADRLLDNPMIGHVGRFGDYQLDVQAMVLLAETLQLPRPWHLLAHSMGGAIGLRALYDGLGVDRACFSAPMWGIRISATLRPVAWTVGTVLTAVGKADGYSPGTKPHSYVATEPFETNTLTTDAEMFDYMRVQLQAEPGFGLGGPSVNWLFEALKECRALAARPAPAQECLTWLGGQESIVSTDRIHRRMQGWPNGQLDLIPHAQHEVLMEDRDTRNRVADQIAAFLNAGQGQRRHA